MGSLRQMYWHQRMQQRELSTAAKVIQNAYRLYRRNAQTRQRQVELERKAAVVIQTYYRRYKQYCNSKKLHRAAALIQRQFRLYKSAKRKLTDHLTQERRVLGASSGDDAAADQQPLIEAFTEYLQNAIKSNRSESMGDRRENGGKHDDSNLSNDEVAMVHCSFSADADEELCDAKRVQAALRIQQAFRGHRKRLAAAAGRARKHRRCSTSSLVSNSERLSPNHLMDVQ